MSQPFVGEIRIAGFNFPPAGWARCDGSLLPISENDVLFNLIGTTYGGDGQTTFALPDLRGRMPVHAGSGLTLGQTGGAEQVTLNVNQIPSHTHVAQAQNNVGNSASPANSVWANSTLNQFTAGPAASTMNALNVGATGGNQPHENMMPYTVVNFIISLFGIYPSQN
jgi:microcystin-dependent protein